MTRALAATTDATAIDTVERHAANLYRKINARGRADATTYAVWQGIV